MSSSFCFCCATWGVLACTRIGRHGLCRRSRTFGVYFVALGGSQRRRVTKAKTVPAPDGIYIQLEIRRCSLAFVILSDGSATLPPEIHIYLTVACASDISVCQQMALVKWT